MSPIQNKGKAKGPTVFEPLNQRRTNKTVGQTYGERRDFDANKQVESPGLLQKGLQSIRDRFLGTKKGKKLEGFAHKDDRYESNSARDPYRVIVSQKTRIEQGTRLLTRTEPVSKDQYTRFLDSVLSYLDTPKTTKKT